MRNIKAQFSGIRVLVVSAHDEAIYAEIAFRAGALGYLMKQEVLERGAPGNPPGAQRQRLCQRQRSRRKCCSSKCVGRTESTSRRLKT